MIHTTREALSAYGFDWSDPKIVLALTEGHGEYPGAQSILGTTLASPKHEFLDYRWEGVASGPTAHRFIAFDGRAVYFPTYVDRYTWVRRVLLDPNEYLPKNAPQIPYIGADGRGR